MEPEITYEIQRKDFARAVYPDQVLQQIQDNSFAQAYAAVPQLEGKSQFPYTEAKACFGECMSGKDVRVGLRLLEFETGLASNIDDTHSAELVDYEISRIAGQAARVAMLIKGQDVIEDETRLKKLLAVELGMSGPNTAP